jgi:hypothetical protein
VDEGVRQLAAVNMDDVNKGLIEIDDVGDILAPKFATMFASLLNVMAVSETKQLAKKKKLDKQALKIQSASAKRPADSEIFPESSKRIRVKKSMTPLDQSTLPQDPHYTGGTDKSGKSIEYKDEESSKQLVFDLLRNSMSALGGDFRRIGWQKDGHRVELVET